jgi:hypothetical protein
VLPNEVSDDGRTTRSHRWRLGCLVRLEHVFSDLRFRGRALCKKMRPTDPLRQRHLLHRRTETSQDLRHKREFRECNGFSAQCSLLNASISRERKRSCGTIGDASPGLLGLLHSRTPVCKKLDASEPTSRNRTVPMRSRSKCNAFDKHEAIYRSRAKSERHRSAMCNVPNSTTGCFRKTGRFTAGWRIIYRRVRSFSSKQSTFPHRLS